MQSKKAKWEKDKDIKQNQEKQETDWPRRWSNGTRLF